MNNSGAFLSSAVVLKLATEAHQRLLNARRAEEKALITAEVDRRARNVFERAFRFVFRQPLPTADDIWKEWRSSHDIFLPFGWVSTYWREEEETALRLQRLAAFKESTDIFVTAADFAHLRRRFL